MKLSEFIKAAQELQDKYGDLEMLTEDYYPVYGVEKFKFDRDEEDWSIKKGDVFATIQDGR
jgi:hypothetical protein